MSVLSDHCLKRTTSKALIKDAGTFLINILLKCLHELNILGYKVKKFMGIYLHMINLLQHFYLSDYSSSFFYSTVKNF